MKKDQVFLLSFSVLLAITVCFGFNSSVLDLSSKQDLDELVSQLDSFSDYRIQLSGHTDDLGGEKYNEHLSEERVIAVKNYLLSKQVDSSRIQCTFYGEQKPLLPNTSEENCSQNRRVELTVSGLKAIPKPSLQSETPERILQDTIGSSKREQATVAVKQEMKRKKVRRRLVWTGWRTGFHWSTSGK